jgi:hypothetical protein
LWCSNDFEYQKQKRFFIQQFVVQLYKQVVYHILLKNHYGKSPLFCKNTVVQGQGRQKNNSKNKNRNFEEIIFSKKVFLHGEKENFEEYSLFLESTQLSFAILINYLARKWRTCPRTTVDDHVLYT